MTLTGPPVMLSASGRDVEDSYAIGRRPDKAQDPVDDFLHLFGLQGFCSGDHQFLGVWRPRLETPATLNALPLLLQVIDGCLLALELVHSGKYGLEQRANLMHAERLRYGLVLFPFLRACRKGVEHRMVVCAHVANIRDV